MELAYFDDPLINKNLENAQAVAELVEDCKKAEAATKKDEALLNKIALQQTNRTLAYKVVNFREARVEEKRNERVKKIEEEITNNNIKRAANDKLIRGFRERLTEAVEEKGRAEVIYKSRANLRSLLTGA
ncbi:3467_t:CDS:2, partial [Ambispora gerdemannii]